MINQQKKSIRNNKEKFIIRDILYLAAFSVYIIKAFLGTTMFFENIPNKISILVRIFMAIVIFAKIIIFDTYSYKKLIVHFIFANCIVLASLLSGYSNLLDLGILLIGAKDIELRKIVKTHFIIIAPLLAITVISSKIGIIENLQYLSPNGKIRNSFGIIYPTNFASYIFYLVLSYSYIKKTKISCINIAVYISLAAFIFNFCYAKLDAISIILTVIVFLYIKSVYKFKFGRIVENLLIYSMPICITVSIGITYIYTEYNNILFMLNKVLSDRLRLGNLGIQEYGLSLFGQQVTMNGYGGKNDIETASYFFIDSSYIQMLLKYGIVLSIIICILIVVYCKKSIKQGNIKLPFIIALIAVNSTVAHHFLDLNYNPFILMIFSFIGKESYDYSIIKGKLFWNKRIRIRRVTKKIAFR